MKIDYKNPIEINLNKVHGIFLSEVDRSKLHIFKYGRKRVYVEFDPASGGHLMEIYDYLNKDRNKFSKYEGNAHLHMVDLSKYAYLDRKFFEHSKEISHAQFVLGWFREYVNR